MGVVTRESGVCTTVCSAPVACTMPPCSRVCSSAARCAPLRRRALHVHRPISGKLMLEWCRWPGRSPAAVLIEKTAARWCPWCGV